MSYSVKATRNFPRPASAVLATAGQVVVQLGGKLPKKPVEGHVQADFNKTVGGTAFGNRVQLIVRVVGDGSERCIASLEATPVDVLGKPLLFGVVGEPAQLVARAFWDQLEARLTPAAP